MRRLALLTAVAMSAALVAWPALAQQGQPGSRQSQPAGGGTQASQHHLITIDFAGGTLAELVRAMKAASPDRPVNILYSTEAANIPIPPFEVAQADLNSTLRSLAYTSAGSPATLGAGRTVRWDIHPVGEGVYAVQIDNSPQYISTPRGQMLAGQSDRMTVVHAITELTTGAQAMSADAVLSAIQAALSIEEAAQEPKIRYHEETGLIFARVSHAQSAIIEQTLVNLGRSAEARQRDSQRSKVQQILEMTGSQTTDELISRVNTADGLRHRVLELQRTVSELRNHIIELQAALDRRDVEERDGGGD